MPQLVKTANREIDGFAVCTSSGCVLSYLAKTLRGQLEQVSGTSQAAHADDMHIHYCLGEWT
jgi:hypothetical protein